MPYLHINGADIYYERQGEVPETVVFAHGLLWSGYLFHNQVEALRDRYTCVTFDFRGQGQTEVTASGYDIETLYGDTVALIEALGCAPCHFVGLSMGGFVGLRLGIRRPDLLKSLTLMETSADPEAKEAARQYSLLSFVARWIGLRIVADRVMKIMFGHKFLSDPARADLRLEWRQRMISNDRVGITRAVTGVFAREGVAEQLAQISVPTLIVVGDQDVATPRDKAESIHAAIPNSQLVVIPGAGHSSTVEEPEATTAALEEFLARQ